MRIDALVDNDCGARSLLDGDFRACLHELSAGHGDFAWFVGITEFVLGIRVKSSQLELTAVEIAAGPGHLPLRPAPGWNCGFSQCQSNR